MKRFEQLNPKTDKREILRRFQNRMKALTIHKQTCSGGEDMKTLLQELHKIELQLS